MNKYDRRYADNWSETAVEAKQLVKGLCCYPGCKRKAVEVHHSCYRDKDGAIAGREIAGVHVFPLCSYHHSKEKGCAHHRRNWKVAKIKPEVNNRNTSAFYKKLRQGWTQKRYLDYSNLT